MKILLICLLFTVLPVRAAMDITRELEAPEHAVPGQPLRVAITFWTDSWFNPPPQWPEFKIENGNLLTTALPNQLLSRQLNGTSWSGVRLERQIVAWDQGTVRLPEFEVTLSGAGQPPVTVKLPALEKVITWPEDVQQPDRFLPASQLTLSQKITVSYAGSDKILHAGDAVERLVTVKAKGILPAQIPQLLFAIPDTETQRLTPVNTLLTSGRGEVDGALREERLRYLPSQAGRIVLPPVQLRWWDTENQQWQLAQLPGSTMQVAPPRASGKEQTLRGTTGEEKWFYVITIGCVVILFSLIVFFRRYIRRVFHHMTHLWQRFWRPVSLPELIPTKRSKR